MVRSVPRASAGLSRLAASPVPAEPPAPIRVCASSMNRMIGVGELCTSSITERSRCSNSPFIDAPACIRPTSSMHKSHAAQRRRHIARGDALRKSLDDGGLADAGLAGEDRVVLAPAHQNVDDLPDLVVAAEDRIHLAGFRLGGEILGKAIERRRALRRRRRSCGARRTGRDEPGAVHRAQVLLLGAGPDLAVLAGQEYRPKSWRIPATRR